MRQVSPIDSLVAAVLKENGDGLVMHVGERPYVLSANGSSNLSERTLTVDAMKGVLGDLLSPAEQETLDDIGAVEREVTSKDAPGDKLLLVAARGGDDIWIELRRQRAAGTRPKTSEPAPRGVAPPPAHQAAPAVEAGPQAPVSEASLQADHAPRPRMAPSHPQAQPLAPTPGARTSGPASLPPAHLDEPALIPPPARRTGPIRDTSPGVLPPLARGPIRTDAPRTGTTPTPRHLGIGRLLRIASARGASSLYLTATPGRPSGLMTKSCRWRRSPLSAGPKSRR
jgi:hypothetical protein